MIYPVPTILLGLAATYVAATVLATLVARTGFPLPRLDRRIGCVDGLRGYLALSVLVHHAIVWMQVTRLGGGWSPPSIHFFNQLGAGSVALGGMTTGGVFYPRVLAGFRACAWPAIYTTRVFRIVPLVAVSIAIIVLIVAARSGHGPTKGDLTAVASWITTWGEPPLLGDPDSGRINAYVLWSLWYEWLFYLFVLPACAVAADLIRGRLPIWIVPLALLAGSILARMLGMPGSMLPYLQLFPIGMLAYELQSRAWIARSARGAPVSVVAAIALATAMTAAPTPYTLAAPLFGVFFACIACGNTMWGVLETKGALVLGECSYGIYLLHGIVLSLLFVDAARWIGAIPTFVLPVIFPTAAVAVLLIAPITYLLVERPAIGVGRRLARLWTGRSLRPGTAELEVAP